MNKPVTTPPSNTSEPPPKIPAAALLVLGSSDLSNSITEIKKEREEVFKEEKFTIGDFNFASYNSPLPAVESVIKYSNSTNFRGNAEVPEVRPGIPVRTMMKIKSNLIPGAGNLLQSLTVDSKYIILVGTFLNKIGKDSKSSSYNSSLLFEQKIVLPSKPVDINIIPAVGESLSLTGIVVDYKVFTVRSEKTYYSITVLYSKLPIRQKLKPIILDPVTDPSSTTQVEPIQPTTEPTSESTSESTSEPTSESTPESSTKPTSDTTQTYKIANENLKKAKDLKDKSISLISSDPTAAIQHLNQAVSLLNDNINKSARVDDSKLELNKCYELLGRAYFNRYKTTKNDQDLVKAKEYLDKLTNKPEYVKSTLNTIEGILSTKNTTSSVNKLLKEAKDLQNQQKLDKLREALKKANELKDKGLINKVKASLFDLWVESTNIYILQKNKQEANSAFKEAKKYQVTEQHKQILTTLQTEISKLPNSPGQNSKPIPPNPPNKTPTPTLSSNEIIEKGRLTYKEELAKVERVNSTSNESSITRLERSIKDLIDLYKSASFRNSNRKQEVETLIDNSYKVISQIYLLLASKNSYNINYIINYINKAAYASRKMSKKDQDLVRKIEQYRQTYSDTFIIRNQSPGSRTPVNNILDNQKPAPNTPGSSNTGSSNNSASDKARSRIDEAKRLIPDIDEKLFKLKGSEPDELIKKAHQAISLLQQNVRTYNPLVNTYKTESSQLINKAKYSIAVLFISKANTLSGNKPIDKETPPQIKTKYLSFLKTAHNYLLEITYFTDPTLQERLKLFRFNVSKEFNRVQGL